MWRRHDRDRRPHRRAGRSRAADRPRSAFCVRGPHRFGGRQCLYRRRLCHRQRLRDRQRHGCGFPGFRAYRRGNHVGSYWFRIADHRRSPAGSHGRAPDEMGCDPRPPGNTCALGCGDRECGRVAGRGRVRCLAWRRGRRRRLRGRFRSRRHHCRRRRGRGRRRFRHRGGAGHRCGSGPRQRRGCRFEGLRIRRDRRGCRRRRGGDRARRKKAQGIDVPVRVARQADAEVQVRLGPLGVTRPAERPDRIAFIDRRAPSDPQ